MDAEEYSKEDVKATEKFFAGMQRFGSSGYPFETYEDGYYDIQFVGEDRPRRGIHISHAIRTGYGTPLYLVSPDGTVWNWSTIIKTKRVSDATPINKGESK